MFQKRVTPIATAALVIVSCAATYVLDQYFHKKISSRTDSAISNIKDSVKSNLYKSERIKGFKLIRPLLFAELTEEASSFATLKAQINSYIKTCQNKRKLISASVYLMDIKNLEWMSINDSEAYFPGSLIKVPGLITFLKMSESHPELLEKKLTLTTAHHVIPYQTYNSDQIQAGKSYTVRELLKYMISYSDNNATYLLNKNVDLKTFQKLFDDLGIPRLTKSEGRMTARHFSRFLRIVFNASYLNEANSEFAAELLEACDFKLGMVKGLPVNTIVAHKFGEMGDETTRQLHESGLVYIKGDPYLLTIMTKGYKVEDLPEVISHISGQVYQQFLKRSETSKQ